MASIKNLALLRSLKKGPSSTSALKADVEASSEATHSASPLIGRKRKSPEPSARSPSPIELEALSEPEASQPSFSWGGFPSLSLLAPNFRFKEFMSGILNTAFRRHVRQRDPKEVLSRIQEDLVKAAGFIGCYEEELSQVPDLKKQVGSLETEKAALHSQVDALQAKVKAFEDKEEGQKKELSDLKEKLKESGEKCRILEGEKAKAIECVAESEAERAKVIKAWSDSSSDIFNNVLAQVRVLVGPEVDLSEVGIFRHVVDGRIEDIPEEEE